MPTAPGAEISIADFLLAWRRRLGLEQKEAAAVLGLSVRTLRSWEKGEGCLYPRLVVLACERATQIERERRDALHDALPR